MMLISMLLTLMFLAFMLFFRMLLSQGILRISQEVINLFEPTIIDDVRTFKI